MYLQYTIMTIPSVKHPVSLCKTNHFAPKGITYFLPLQLKAEQVCRSPSHDGRLCLVGMGIFVRHPKVNEIVFFFTEINI